MNKPILAEACKPGDRVAIVAPAGPFQLKWLHAGCDLLRSWGLEPVYHQDICSGWGYLAAEDDKRLQIFVDAFTDPTIKAVICARGGYGCARLIEQLPYEILKKHPKRFFGFSDITFIHQALFQKLNWITFHSPMAASQQMLEGTKESQERLKLALFESSLETLCPPIPGTPFRGESAQGTLIGGNLSLLLSTLGTPWQLNTDGAILFIEDVGEAPYRIDRMFQQMKMAGLFEKLGGLVIGDFGPLQDQYTTYDAKEFWLNRLDLPASFPVLFDVPAGHIRNNWTLPLGTQAALDMEKAELRIVS